MSEGRGYGWVSTLEEVKGKELRAQGRSEPQKEEGRFLSRETG